jgi:hypothetical protein
MFVENVGQFDDPAAGAGVRQPRFAVQGDQGMLRIDGSGVWLTLIEPIPLTGLPPSPDQPEIAPTPGPGWGVSDQVGSSRRGVNIRISFVGGNPDPLVDGVRPVDTTVSYLIGNDPNEWYPDVPVWEGVRYLDLYPDVDLELTSDRGAWAWRLVLKGQPATADQGTDTPAQLPASGELIRFKVEGGIGMVLDQDSLRITTEFGEIPLPMLAVTKADGSPIDLESLVADLSGNEVIITPATPLEGSGPTLTETATAPAKETNPPTPETTPTQIPTTATATPTDIQTAEPSLTPSLEPSGVPTAEAGLLGFARLAMRVSSGPRQLRTMVASPPLDGADDLVFSTLLGAVDSAMPSRWMLAVPHTSQVRPYRPRSRLQLAPFSSHQAALPTRSSRK